MAKALTTKPLTVNNLVEAADSDSPGSGTANMRGQNESLVFDVKAFNAAAGGFVDVALNGPSFRSLRSLILGRVRDLGPDPANPTIGLNRVLPLAHPIYQDMYASNYRRIGAGQPVSFAVNGLNPNLTPSLPSVAISYPNNRVTVDFTPRLYNVWPDSFVPVQQSSWSPPGVKNNPDGTPATAPVVFSFAPEWLRFCDFDVQPSDDWINFNLGAQMWFLSSNALVNQQQMADLPRIRIPNSRLKLTWYQVPYRYVISLNSYLEKYKGHVNQNNWYIWEAGQLLYMNYQVQRYQQPQADFGRRVVFANSVPVPPVPPRVMETVPGIGQGGSPLQTCDIVLDIVITRRKLPQGETAPVPTFANNVANGHNLFPWGTDRQFHYAETIDSFGWFNPVHNGGFSFWPSAPFEILFANPDVIQAGI